MVSVINPGGHHEYLDLRPDHHVLHYSRRTHRHPVAAGVLMHTWSITESYLMRKTWELTALDNEDVCRQMQAFADQANRNIGTLQFDDFHDEIHARFTRNGRTRIFMRIQYEGLA